jgi:hypothetical protein
MSTITATSMIASRLPVGVERDVRSMLLAAGVGQYDSTMLVTQMFLMPRTTDPSAQATILIVAGAQRLLGLKQTGRLDEPTLVALRKVSGPYWTNKTWVQIYGDLLDNAPVNHAMKAHHGLSDYIEVGDTATSISVGALAVGVGLLFLAMR